MGGRRPRDLTRRRQLTGLVVAIVLASAAATAWYRFGPAPPGSGGFAFVRSVPGDTATLWAVGDGDAGRASRALVDRIAADRPDRLLYLGDVYERGTAADFRENYAPS